jgi:hypothetical protein
MKKSPAQGGEHSVEKKSLKIQSEDEKISESISIQKKNLPNFL